MAAVGVPGDHGGAGDHGGRGPGLRTDRRRVVGFLRSVVSLVRSGGFLTQVFLLLNITLKVENPIDLQLTT